MPEEQESSERFNALFDAEDLTLENLLQDEDIVSEMRHCNQNLLDFLTVEKLVQMVRYIHAADLDCIDGADKNVYPFVCAEILSSDDAPILDRFFTGSELLESLFCCLETDEQINYTSAGYIAKVSQALFHRNPQGYLSYVLRGSQISSLLVNHVYCKSIAQILTNILIVDNSFIDINRLETFQEERLGIIKMLLDKYSDSMTLEESQNVQTVLTDLIDKEEDINSWKVFISEILNTSTQLLSKLETANSYCITSLCNIITSLMKHNSYNTKISTWAKMPLSEALVGNVQYIAKGLGDNDGCVGSVRIALLKLITNFLGNASSELVAEIVDHEVMELATELFFKYVWNSVLSTHYTDIVRLILNSDSHQLKQALLIRARLPDRIISTASEIPTTRPGHFGQLIQISNLLVKGAEIHFDIKSKLLKCVGWDAFCAEFLTPANEVENKQICPISVDSFGLDDEFKFEDIFNTGSMTSEEIADFEKELEEDGDKVQTRGESNMAELPKLLEDILKSRSPNGSSDFLEENLFKANDVLNTMNTGEEVEQYNSNNFWSLNPAVELEDIDDL